jgi:hypothetical protein
VPSSEASAADPLGEYLRRLQEESGDLFVLGLQRTDALVARRWQELQRQGEGLGFARLVEPVGELAAGLEHKSHSLNWEWQSAGRALLRLAIVVRMAQDLTGA